MAPVISDGEDEILLSFHRLQLKLFDYYREQVIVKEKEFLQRLCPPNSNEVSLEDFSRNLVLHIRYPQWKADSRLDDQMNKILKKYFAF